MERPGGAMGFPFPAHSFGSPLTIVEAGDTQGLRRVQRKAVLGILDVGHDWHGVEVGLQGQLLQIPPGLHLWGNTSQSRASAPLTLGPQEVPSLKGSLMLAPDSSFSIRAEHFLGPVMEAKPSPSSAPTGIHSPESRNHLKAVEVCEEGALTVNVRVDAQGQLLVDIVPDVHQG